ncbi:MAG TPA: DUF2752 domain-containing protein [archaeon]|nr:DUF2752 domain-containing protein [archaeon]
MKNNRPGIKAKLPEPAAARRLRARRVSLTLLFVFTITFVVDAGTIDSLPQICIWRKLTGLPCPFCGLIHSLCALSHGSFSLAADYHLFGPLVYAAGVILLASSLYTWATGRTVGLPGRFGTKPERIIFSLGLVWIIWWLARLFILARGGF